MNKVDVKRNGTVILTLSVDDTFVFSHTLMGEKYITCSYVSISPLLLQVGDYIEWENERYTIFDPPQLTRTGGAYSYNITFYGLYYTLHHILLKDEGSSTFSYYGTIQDHLSLLLQNVATIESNFSLGTIVETEAQNIEYSNISCYDALVKIAETFGKEYEIDKYEISVIDRVGYDSAYIFEYGYNKGLYSLEKQMLGDASIVTRLYGIGGSENIPASYIKEYGSEKLILPARYIDKNVSIYGVREGVSEFSEIYPRLKDKKILSVTVPSDVESATSWAIQLDIPFPLEGDIIKDREPYVNFLTGELAGESFKIAAKSWNANTRELRILVNDSDGYKLPNSTRQPKVGDTFNLTGINMPTEYIEEAHLELEKAVIDELNTKCIPQYSYNLDIDPKYVRDNNISIHAGDKITIKEENDDVQIRVQSISYPLAKAEKLSITLASEKLYTYEQKIQGEIVETKQEVISQSATSAKKYSSRAYRDAEEAINLLDETLRAEMALIADEDAVFVLSGVFFEVNKNGNASTFYATPGQLQHDKYKDNDWNGRWVFENEFYGELPDETKPYFLYARCSKSQNTAMFVLSVNEIDTEQIESYYHFRVGIVSSVYNQTRTLTQTYGFTTIAGGDIKTGRLLSANGETYFDLDAGEIGGKIILSDASRTDAGETIITGGKINTRLIDTDTLVAKKIESREGTIADFTIQEKQLVGEGNKVIFSNDVIPTLEQLLSLGDTSYPMGNASVVTMQDTATMSEGRVELSLYAYVPTMEIPYAGMMTFRVKNERIITWNDEGGKMATDSSLTTIKVQRINTDGSLTDIAAYTIEPNTTRTISTYIPHAGSYRVIGESTHSCQSMWIETGVEQFYPTYTLEARVEILGSATDGMIHLTGGSECTHIGTDGLYSFWSAINYLYFSQDEGMKFKGSFTATSANGEYKLSITDNGIIITGDISADYSTGKVIFDVAAARENIASGETFEELFGKVKRYFTDLKTVAFTGSYKDLIDKPEIPDTSKFIQNTDSTTVQSLIGTSGLSYVENGTVTY